MPRYPAGSGVTLSFQVYAADGKTPMDATNPVVTMRRPPIAGVAQADKTYSGAGITHVGAVSSGQYQVPVSKADVAVVGHYPWIATADVPDFVLARKAFEIVDPFEPVLLTLAEGKAALGRTSRAVDDDELQLHIDTATEQLQTLCGAIVPRVDTVPLKPIGDGQLWPEAGPVLAVQSATWLGTTLNTSTWSVDPVTERIINVPRGSQYPHRYRYREHSTDLLGVLRLGREPIPASLNLAGRILTQHLWATQRAGVGAAAGGQDTVDTGYGFAIPNRVAQLIRPYVDEFGIA